MSSWNESGPSAFPTFLGCLASIGQACQILDQVGSDPATTKSVQVLSVRGILGREHRVRGAAVVERGASTVEMGRLDRGEIEQRLLAGVFAAQQLIVAVAHEVRGQLTGLLADETLD